MANLRSAMTIQVLVCGEAGLKRWGHTPLAEPFWRIYHNADPGWSIDQDGRRITLDPQRVVVVPPGCVFTTNGPQPARHCYIHFTLTGFAGEVGARIVDLPLDPALGAAFDRIRTLPGEAEAWRRQAAALAAIGPCLAQLPEALVAAERFGDTIAAAVAHLEANCHRPVPVDELADLVGMHPNALIRRFRQEVGTTPHRHHLRLRCDRAAGELLHADRAIEDVALDHGFCDRHHFSRAFARVRGVPPARYRVLARGG